MPEKQIKSYKISANSKKSTYETEQWTNKIDDKLVELLVTKYYRWGIFTINLTEKQKKEILKKDSIILNGYDYEFQEIWDGDSLYVEIENKEQYSEEELTKINNTIYEGGREIYDEDFMENNGWCLDDTIYGFSCGCVLEPIS